MKAKIEQWILDNGAWLQLALVAAIYAMTFGPAACILSRAR